MKIYLFKLKISLIICLAALDLFTKLAALKFLQYDTPISFNGFSLHLIYNDTGTNSVIESFGYSSGGSIILLSLFYILLGITGLIFSRINAGRAFKVLTYIFIFIIYIFFFNTLKASIPEFYINPYIMNLIRFISGLFLGISFLAISRDKIYSVIWAMYAGAGIGNFINIFHPPYAIIDFLYSASLYRNFGVGIFNLADVIIFISVLAFIVYSIIYAIRLIVRKIFFYN